MKMKKFLILSLLSFVLCLKSGVFAVDVSGPIVANTTWTLAGHPYVVTGDVTVSEGRTLTIDPGVMVKFDSNTSLFVNGMLLARGTIDSTITFTSNGVYPWGCINFAGSAVDPVYDTVTGNYMSGSGCIIENAVVAYGGGGIAGALLKIVGSEPFINNVIVRNSASIGIYVEGGKPKIRNSTINNNSLYGVYVCQYGECLDIEGCTIRNNSSTGLYVSMAGGWVRNNTISNNLGSGVEISGDFDNVAICKNLIKQNSSYGVCVSGSGNCTLGGNLILSNEAGGVSACGGFLMNNIIADNLSTAIHAGSSAPDIVGNVIINNISDYYTVRLQYCDYYGKVFNKNLVMSNVTKDLSVGRTVYLSNYGYGENPVVNNNNFINNTAPCILGNAIYSSFPVNAENNWWGTVDDSTIQELIYDQSDYGYYSMVDYMYPLLAAGPEAPISPPTGVRLDTSYQIYGQVPVIWEPNVESDTTGYKVYWDNDGFPFDSVVDVGGVASYTIYTTANVYVAVTAYDTGYALANDYATTIVNENQTSGHESWYSRLNRLPSVSLLASPSSGNVPLYVYLIATAQDSDGNIVSYWWDFNGDGTFETTTASNSISYIYETAGTYHATVKVTDNSGGQASVSMDVVCNNPAHANQPPIVNAWSDTWMISPGDGVGLHATAYDPDYDSVSFRWSCPSCTTSIFIEPGPDSPNCTWLAPMDTTVLGYELVCRVTDARGAYADGYVYIHINQGSGNQPPSIYYVYASRMYGINAGEQISLNVSAYDPDGDPLSYNWTQRAANNAVDTTGVFSNDTGVVVSWTAPVVNAADVWGLPSVYFILKCSVNDGHNHTDWREVQVEVMTVDNNRVNILPTVDLTFAPDFACVPVMINFEAVAADADGWIKKYEWDFDGNGAYETATEWRRMTYIYNSAGVYNARVRVTDNDDSTAVDSTTVNILSQNVPPTITSFIADKTSGPVPLTVSFTASAYDTDGTIRNYQWDFDGNGNYETTTVNNSASYTYLSPGTYYANVNVSDNSGATANAGVYIMPYPSSGVTNSPPFIDIWSDIATVPPGGRVRVYASGHDPDGDVINYRWYCYAGYFANFSGDSTSCDWVAPLNPSGPANYELGCEATDGKGGSAQRSIWIYMNYQANYNCPPWVTIIPSKYQANFNETITLSATASDPDGDPLTYEWGANNGVFNYATAAVVSWTAPNYPTGVNIFVKVRDGRGGEGWAEVFINVYSTLPPPPTVNQPPIITDVHPDMNTIAPSGKVRLFASAYDPDYDSVSYNWRSVSGAGSFTNPGSNSANCDWYAPPNLSGPASYELICEVKDTRGGVVQKSVWIYMNYGGGNYNKPPVMSPIVSSKTYGIRANEEIYLYAFAYDPDGDTTLTYTWRQEFTDTAYVRLGTFTPATGSSTKWKAPLIRAWQVGNKHQVFFFIECEVSDGRGGIVNKRISVEVLTGSNEPVIIATPVSGNAPLTVDFTVDADTTNIVKYEWDFDGNGTFDKTDTTTNIARNIYMKEGNYAAKVKVHHRSGGSVTSQPVTITVGVGPVMGNIDTVSPGSALRVDGFDLYALSVAFGTTPQDQGWNQFADLDDGEGQKGIINGNDLIILAVNFGRRLR